MITNLIQRKIILKKTESTDNMVDHFSNKILLKNLK